MHALSNQIRTEPFIISGTSLTEPDLEYYLGARAGGTESGRADISLLVEPNPDSGTEEDCRRFNLVLVRAALKDFAEWIEARFGAAPNLSSIRLPAQAVPYSTAPDADSETTFFEDFERVQLHGSEATPEPRVSSFYFGRPPTWGDIRARRDVPLKSQLALLDPAIRWSEQPRASQVIVGLGAPGSGSSTSLKRIALDLVSRGRLVFYLRTKASPDLDAATNVIKGIDAPVILCFDNIAERVDFVRALLLRLGPSFPLLALGVEREYRRDHIESVLSELTSQVVDIGGWGRSERAQLVENYRRLGLVGHTGALQSTRDFAGRLARDTIAEAVCRILNDFRPLRTIVTSLWKDAIGPIRETYLVAALAHFCVPQGLRASVLAGATAGIHDSAFDRERSSLPLATNPDDSDFVIPLNSTVSSQLLMLMSRERPDRLLQGFIKLGDVLAPYVTRDSIMRQTAEARLAGRLFDSDKVVRPLLSKLSDDFYEQCKESWQWNSRYWEQRALGLATDELDLAVRYARQAVAIERHAFPMTTLAKLLQRQLEENPESFTSPVFKEVFDILKAAIDLEKRSGRHRLKPAYWVLFGSVLYHLRSGKTLNSTQLAFVRECCESSSSLFFGDSRLLNLVEEVERAIKPRRRKQ
jgi:hypothetical protein